MLYKIEYLEVTNLGQKPCPGPNIVPRVLYTQGDPLCLDVAYGSTICVTVEIEATCCNPAMYLGKELPANSNPDTSLICVGADCSTDLGNCPKIQWYSLLPGGCTSNLTAGERDPLDQMDRDGSPERYGEVLTPMAIRALAIYDLQGRMRYTTDHPTDSWVSRRSLFLRYGDKMVPRINLLHLYMKDGTRKTIKLVKYPSAP